MGGRGASLWGLDEFAAVLDVELAGDGVGDGYALKIVDGGAGGLGRGDGRAVDVKMLRKRGFSAAVCADQ